MDTRKITTKDKAQLLLTGASIDGNYGTWSSIQEYENFITNDVGLDAPFDSTTIAVKDASTGKITKYIRENGVWREDVPATLTAQIVGIANSINTVEGNVTALQGGVSALDTKVDNNIESMAESAQAAAQSASAAEASAQAATTHLATIQEQIGKMTDSEGVIIPEQVVLNVSEQKTQLDTLGSKINSLTTNVNDAYETATTAINIQTSKNKFDKTKTQDGELKQSMA